MERQFRVEFREAPCSTTEIINVNDDNLPTHGQEKSHIVTSPEMKEVSIAKYVCFTQSDEATILPPQHTSSPMRRPVENLE